MEKSFVGDAEMPSLYMIAGMNDALISCHCGISQSILNTECDELIALNAA
jgi:hypothetical protein